MEAYQTIDVMLGEFESNILALTEKLRQTNKDDIRPLEVELELKKLFVVFQNIKAAQSNVHG